MITFIAFLLTIAGSINWFLIGILQYDYIAGFFGFQASLMSRIFYVLFGIGAIYLVLRVIINKGTFKIWERKKKKEKEDEKSFEKSEKEERKAVPVNHEPAYSNIEASKEQIAAPQFENQTEASKQAHAQFVDFGRLREFRDMQNVNSENLDAKNPNGAIETFERAQNYDKNFNSSFPENSPSNSSAQENFFEPQQEQNKNETLFDEHMNAKK